MPSSVSEWFLLGEVVVVHIFLLKHLIKTLFAPDHQRTSVVFYTMVDRDILDGLRGRPFSYSWQQREEVIALRKQGLTYKEISNRTGLTPAAVHGVFWRIRHGGNTPPFAPNSKATSAS